MKLGDSEKKIAEHGWSILTDKAIIQEKYNFLGSTYNEIPIEMITSIKRKVITKKIFLILSLISFIFSGLVYLLESLIQEIPIISISQSNNFIYPLGVGVLFLIIFFFTVRDVIIIFSPTSKIIESSRDSKNFIYKIRDLLYF